METLRKAVKLLPRNEQLKALRVCFLLVAMALFEALGVLSVMPFLSVLVDPGAIDRSQLLLWAFEKFGFESKNSFLIFLGFSAFGLLLLSAVVRSFCLYSLALFTQMLRHILGAQLLEAYLRQPYECFVARHTSDLSKSILSEVDNVTDLVFLESGRIITQSCVLASMVILVVAVDPMAAILAACVLGCTYGTIYLTVRRYLRRSGSHFVVANRERFEATSNALSGVKVVKLLGQERRFLERFLKPSFRYARTKATSKIIAETPKFIVEAICFGGILLLALMLIMRHDDNSSQAFDQILPLLGLYVFAGYRMLPAIQIIFEASSRLKFGANAVETIGNDIRAAAEQRELPDKEEDCQLTLDSQITFNKVSYTYPLSDVAGIHNINLEVPAGSMIGIVGRTGAGKTTFADILLGLLSPQEGWIEIDGTRITETNIRQWQASLGYVPQDLFLINASVAENIAFGLSVDDIDQERVRECARAANIHQFVEAELSQGYDTEIGERGVRLSGGQRQRIGIARALYRDPEVFVFDEATSALDNHTENAVMTALNSLRGVKTTFIIAHRLTTVRKCHLIIVMEKGQIVGKGSYDELSRDNTPFKEIVQAAETSH